MNGSTATGATGKRVRQNPNQKNLEAWTDHGGVETEKPQKAKDIDETDEKSYYSEEGEESEYYDEEEQKSQLNKSKQKSARKEIPTKV